MSGKYVFEKKKRDPMDFLDVEFYMVEHISKPDMSGIGRITSAWVHDIGCVTESDDDEDGPYTIIEYDRLYLDPREIGVNPMYLYVKQTEADASIRHVSKREAKEYIRNMLNNSKPLEMRHAQDATPAGMYYDMADYTQMSASGLPILQIYESWGVYNALSVTSWGEYVWGHHYNLDGNLAGNWVGGRYRFDLDELIHDEVHGNLVLDNVGWGDLNRKKWE